jgi:hypothetical protein
MLTAGHPLITHAMGTGAVEMGAGCLLGFRLRGIKSRHGTMLGLGSGGQAGRQRQGQDGATARSAIEALDHGSKVLVWERAHRIPRNLQG